MWVAIFVYSIYKFKIVAFQSLKKTDRHSHEQILQANS